MNIFDIRLDLSCTIALIICRIHKHINCSTTAADIVEHMIELTYRMPESVQITALHMQIFRLRVYRDLHIT